MNFYLHLHQTINFKLYGNVTSENIFTLFKKKKIYTRYKNNDVFKSSYCHISLSF